MTLKLAFMGTPAFSVPTLSALIEAGHEMAAVYTQPPRRSGRGQKEQRSAVHDFALSKGLTVFCPTSLKSPAEQATFAALDLDVAIVVAYGQLLPKPILEAPRLGCLNLHTSLLPRWRGAAPIQRAIMAGDAETGVMVMQMDEGLDTGPIYLSEKVAIDPSDTTASLEAKLEPVGASLVVLVLAALESKKLQPVPQSEEGATYAKKITKGEAQIDWHRSAEELDYHIRGLSPFPGAWFELPGKKEPIRVKVLKARPIDKSGEVGTLLEAPLTIACGKGALAIEEVQRAGRSPSSAEAFRRGFDIPLGTKVI